MLPISWYQLIHEKTRLTVATVAVSFAVILMFMEFGFQSALFDSSALVHQNLNGDLFIISRRSSSLAGMKQFSRRPLYGVLSKPGVSSVTPIYIGFAPANLHALGTKTRRILVLGIEPQANATIMPQVQSQEHKLCLRDDVLFDSRSRREFGPVLANLRSGIPTVLDIGHSNLNIVGSFELGTSFSADGNVIASADTFRHVFPNRKAGSIDIGIVQIQAGRAPKVVQTELQRCLSDDLLVLSKHQFMQFEKRYWQEATAIGFIFNVGVALSLVVGAAIVYQILYANVNEHLGEYATLKAIGFNQGTLANLVLEQAVILAGLGFIPGVLIAARLYEVTHDITGLPMSMSVAGSTWVLALIVVMCSVSGMLAIERLRHADPASLF